MHLFADISSHGFGHLAIGAPVLNAVAALIPKLRLTVRSALPEKLLRERITIPFDLLPEASDFGFIMRNATLIDHAASAEAYRAAHLNWPQRVAQDAELLQKLRVDRVLSNISYLPLAAAAETGLPAFALCSLNWADLFWHYFGDSDWARPLHEEMLAAYRSATFIRITPGMPMPMLPRQQVVGPISVIGQRHDLGLGKRSVMVAMGGIAHRLPIEQWPRTPGILWLTPPLWRCRHPDAVSWDQFGLGFTDLLASVDAIVTKPGYGTFTEAAANGTPVLYQRRDDWPEQDCLIEWLAVHGNAREIAVDRLHGGDLLDALAALWARPQPPRPLLDGAQAAARIITA